MLTPERGGGPPYPRSALFGGKRGRGPPSLSQPLFGGPRPRLPPPPAPPSPGPALSPARLSPRPRPGPGAPLPRPARAPGPPLPWPALPRPCPGPRARPPRAHEPPSTRSLARGLKPAGRPQIYKYSGELDAATELLDRALYCLEAAWHPQFKPASGACRLDFAVMENKAWSSGACRCSFAAAAPAPPSCIDYFALRAREYKFLLELVAAPALPGAPPPYALMRVARDGGAAPVDELVPCALRISSKTEARQVLRRLFSHTLDPPRRRRPALCRGPRRRPPAAGGPHVPRRRPPLLENYNVKPDSGGWAALHRRPSSTTTSRPPASSSRP
eukprot:tig00000950_g5761.t1